MAGWADFTAARDFFSVSNGREAMTLGERSARGLTAEGAVLVADVLGVARSVIGIHLSVTQQASICNGKRNGLIKIKLLRQYALQREHFYGNFFTKTWLLRS
ncbi:MAG: hypothetical protein Q8M33_02440, partial [Hydrogenophaga sp.]|nr:hypothetical protein [Hydrogenophaga sp.]